MPSNRTLAFRINDDEMRSRMFHSYRGPRVYMDDGTDYIVICVIKAENFVSEDGYCDLDKLTSLIPLDIEDILKRSLAEHGWLEHNGVTYILIDK